MKPNKGKKGPAFDKETMFLPLKTPRVNEIGQAEDKVTEQVRNGTLDKVLCLTISTDIIQPSSYSPANLEFGYYFFRLFRPKVPVDTRTQYNYTETELEAGLERILEMYRLREKMGQMETKKEEASKEEDEGEKPKELVQEKMKENEGKVMMIEKNGTKSQESQIKTEKWEMIPGRNMKMEENDGENIQETFETAKRIDNSLNEYAKKRMIGETGRGLGSIIEENSREIAKIIDDDEMLKFEINEAEIKREISLRESIKIERKLEMKEGKTEEKVLVEESLIKDSMEGLEAITQDSIKPITKDSMEANSGEMGKTIEGMPKIRQNDLIEESKELEGKYTNEQETIGLNGSRNHSNKESDWVKMEMDSPKPQNEETRPSSANGNSPRSTEEKDQNPNQNGSYLVKRKRKTVAPPPARTIDEITAKKIIELKRKGLHFEQIECLLRLYKGQSRSIWQKHIQKNGGDSSNISGLTRNKWLPEYDEFLNELFSTGTPSLFKILGAPLVSQVFFVFSVLLGLFVFQWTSLCPFTSLDNPTRVLNIRDISEMLKDRFPEYDCKRASLQTHLKLNKFIFKKTKQYENRADLPEVLAYRRSFVSKMIELFERSSQFIFVEESSFQLQDKKRKAWGKKGLKTYSKKAGKATLYFVMAAMSHEGLIAYQVFKNGNSGRCHSLFMSKLCEILEEKGTDFQRTYFILDNARAHKSEFAKVTINDYLNILVNASYSRFLNPLEKLFSEWRRAVSEKAYFSEEELMEAILRVARTFRKEDVHRAFWNSIGYYEDAFREVDICPKAEPYF